MKHITRSYDSQTPAKAFVGLLFPNWETQTNGQPGTFPTSFPSPSSSSSSSSSSSFSSLLYFINILICFAINISIFIDIVLQYYPLPQNITIPNVSTMADKVSNVSAGVDSARQASAASGAGGGRKDDKRDDRKPPPKNPSRVGKSQTAKRCYNCRKAGHLQKDCPLLAAMSVVYHMLVQFSPYSHSVNGR
ncbi:hypothetical protein EIK77_007036 [Talaromyces pinophilus]|nr:hypothetical protein EIK77_007036 [Talaromyces pinophilus]